LSRFGSVCFFIFLPKNCLFCVVKLTFTNIQKESLLPNVLVNDTCKIFILPPNRSQIYYIILINLCFLKFARIIWRIRYVMGCNPAPLLQNTWAMLVRSSSMNRPGHNHMGLVFICSTTELYPKTIP